ncbi:complement receptor type 2 [Scomber japonicus]|uniref:complement receptor type 2 n=1 Tax=Scomber japonicus TaxID=13676 RepID=UPI002306D948|nr:complement receptor type 2 [Scomber japonicus]
MSLWWNIVFLLFASLASAQVSKICGPPPEYPYTRLAEKYTQRLRFNIGEKVYFNCDDDFTPSRGSRAVQCVGGKWTKLTLKCEKRSCGNAGDLPNGLFQYEGNSLIGEKVYAVCNDGYTLKGLNYMICKKSGWTGEFPTCEEGTATCSSPAVANSVKSGGYVSVYQVGETMTFTCSPGFQLDGAQLVTCGPDGQWQPKPPQCLPSPDEAKPAPDNKGRCGVPENANNAGLADKYFMMTSFASGDRVHYVCDVGYMQAGGSRYRTCNEGKWTRLMMRCEIRMCGSAGEILNGQFMYTGVEFGDVATAICDEGYILVGKDTRNCLSNGWDGRIPVCEAVTCPEPQEVANARREGLQDSSYTYGTAVRYRCQVGTLTGPSYIWCTSNGTWNSPPPECSSPKEITCPAPNVANAYWMRGHLKKFQYRDNISIECKRGYKMSGPSTITCGGNGRWSPGLPYCQRIASYSYWRK